MTKKEYLNQLCKECKKNETCTKRIFKYPAEYACPLVLGVASKAWKAAVEATAEAATNWINKHLAEWSIVDSDDLQDFKETLKQEMK